MGRMVNTRLARVVFLLIVVVVLVGGSFWAGRVYQNNADQSLFNDYNPPRQTSGGTGANGSGFSFTRGASTNSQVSAALAAGTPPPAPTYASSPSSLGAGSGAAGTGAAGTSSNQNAVIGTLVSATGGALTVQTFQGASETLTVTASTRFYQAASKTTQALAVGDRVAIGLDRSDTTNSTAASVTISPDGAPFAQVRAFGGGNGGGFGGGNGGGFGGGNGGGGFGGGGNGGGFGGGGNGGGSGFGGGNGGGAGGAGGFRRQPPPTGTITAVGQGAIQVKTAQGTQRTFKLTSSTAVYALVQVSGSALKTGSLTAISRATRGGQTVAVAVAQAESGGLVSFVS